jgi:RNA polymerase primary sigma factor
MFQDTSLDMYLKLARRYPVMTKEQEQELFAKYKKGGVFGELARQEFLLRNIRLVISIAKRVRVKDSTLEDRVQEGIFGLMRALEKFDGERGCKFSTYATWWVRQSILKSIQHTIRLPPYLLTASNQIRKMEQESGRSFTDEKCWICLWT